MAFHWYGLFIILIPCQGLMTNDRNDFIQLFVPRANIRAYTPLFFFFFYHPMFYLCPLLSPFAVVTLIRVR